MAPKTKSNHTEPITTLAIQTAATRELTPGIEKFLWEIAPRMHKAHLFGVTSPEQAYAIMFKGYELGLSVTASFEFIQVIDGKPGLSPRGAIALLLSNPFVKDIQTKKITDPKGLFLGYECYMERTNGYKHTAKFTLEDATRAGLLKPNSGWAKYPENMCYWRAVGFAADAVFPDITAGMTMLMKAPESYGVALSQDGNIIDVSPVSVPSVDPLQALVTEFGAEAVMAANDGQIPTNEQVAEVRKKLESNTE